jgi:hypothetical protein
VNVRVLITILVVSCGSQAAWAGGGIHGHARFERIKGNPRAGYAELYESNLFISPAQSPPVGPSRRLGAPVNKNPVYDGSYSFEDLPAGKYSILVAQPLFFIRPKVLPDVLIKDGRTIEVNVELPIEYSTCFRDSEQWTRPDTTWYQTFTATGTSVTGVSYTLAGMGATAADVSVLKDNGKDDVRRWEVLGTRQELNIEKNSDNWVRWRSGEIPLTPGKRCAVRITGVGGDGKLQPYKRDKDRDSYKGGQACDSTGTARDFDLNYTVFGDTDGTTITLCQRTKDHGDLKSGYFAERWGQTFKARGRGLAAVDAWAAGAEHKWDLDFTWRIREDNPEGRQVGPVKTTKAAYQASGCGLHGVSYSPGEVPLKPGSTYFIEFEISNPPPESRGFNPYIAPDPYDGGSSYQWKGGRWVQHAEEDLAMTVIEYQK